MTWKSVGSSTRRSAPVNRNILAIAAVCLGSLSCARLHTAHRTTSIDALSTSISVDAKQRFLVAITTTIAKAADRPEQKLRKLCVEPSPDVFAVLSASLEGNLKYMDKATTYFKAALSGAAATDSIRTAGAVGEDRRVVVDREHSPELPLEAARSVVCGRRSKLRSALPAPLSAPDKGCSANLARGVRAGGGASTWIPAQASRVRSSGADVRPRQSVDPLRS